MMIDFVINFPGVEAYENFVFLLRKTSQSWLAEIIESGKAVDHHMRFRPDEVQQPGLYQMQPRGVEMFNYGVDPLFEEPGTYDLISGGGAAGYASDLFGEHDLSVSFGGQMAMQHQNLAASSVINMVRECRQRQINAEQRLVHLQREQLALKHRIGENNREQQLVRNEQASLRQLAVNADRVTRMARQTEITSQLARASLPAAAMPIRPRPEYRTSSGGLISMPPTARSLPSPSPVKLGLMKSYNKCQKVPTGQPIPPVPMTSNLSLAELRRMGANKV